jgi:hypothetical protein
MASSSSLAEARVIKTSVMDTWMGALAHFSYPQFLPPGGGGGYLDFFLLGKAKISGTAPSRPNGY